MTCEAQSADGENVDHRGQQEGHQDPGGLRERPQVDGALEELHQTASAFVTEDQCRARQERSERQQQVGDRDLQRPDHPHEQAREPDRDRQAKQHAKINPWRTLGAAPSQRAGSSGWPVSPATCAS